MDDAEIAEKLWNLRIERAVCPKCGGNKFWVCNKTRKCKYCQKDLSILCGTVFAGCHVPIGTIYRAIQYQVDNPAATQKQMMVDLEIGSTHTMRFLRKRIASLLYPCPIIDGHVTVTFGVWTLTTQFKTEKKTSYLLIIPDKLRGDRYIAFSAEDDIEGFVLTHAQPNTTFVHVPYEDIGMFQSYPQDKIIYQENPAMGRFWGGFTKYLRQIGYGISSRKIGRGKIMQRHDIPLPASAMQDLDLLVKTWITSHHLSPNTANPTLEIILRRAFAVK